MLPSRGKFWNSLKLIIYIGNDCLKFWLELGICGERETLNILTSFLRLRLQNSILLFCYKNNLCLSAFNFICLLYQRNILLGAFIYLNFNILQRV
jgi:hypothetical protein